MTCLCSRGIDSPKRSRDSGADWRKISWMAPISQIPHQGVDAGEGILLAGVGQEQVDHGGLQRGVT